jgi:tetratricopeptide (TPR) repeat protein
MTASREIFEDAQRLLVDGKFTESIEAFTRAINSGEKKEISFLSRGVAYLRNHEMDKAIGDFSEAVHMDDHSIRAHFYRGIAYLTKEDYKSAIADFDRTIKLKPDHGAAFFARGATYAQLGNDELATANVKTAVTFSDANVFGLQETLGLWRTEFDKAISIASGEKNMPEMTLTHDEYHRVMSWLEKGYKEEKYH